MIKLKRHNKIPTLSILFYCSLLLTITCFNACTKTSSTDSILAQKLLEEKRWFLDYIETGIITKNYTGQNTYHINFLKNLTTQDSDGLNGTYNIEELNGQLQIHVAAKTVNGNAIEYIYDIVSVGTGNLILLYKTNGENTKAYYRTKN